MKRKKAEITADDIRKKISTCIARWNSIKQHGCADPIWTDGVNMNIVRNHILYLKGVLDMEEVQMSLFAPTEDISNDYVPPKVDDDYMSSESAINYPYRLCIKEES